MNISLHQAHFVLLIFKLPYVESCIHIITVLNLLWVNISIYRCVDNDVIYGTNSSNLRDKYNLNHNIVSMFLAFFLLYNLILLTIR